jgi:hypothetical protein
MTTPRTMASVDSAKENSFRAKRKAELTIQKQ